MRLQGKLWLGAAGVAGALALVAGLGAMLGSAPAAQAGAAPPRRPNVIVIIADDMGYADISANGVPRIPTPNIDALARNGVRFTDGYVTAAVCSPSRAGLMTGRVQTRYGFEFIPWGRNNPTDGPPPSEVMIPKVMKQAGYATGMVGKWHIGSAPGYHPLDRGFDEYFGMLSGASAYLPKLGPTDEAAITGMDSQLTRERFPISRGREIVYPTGYLTDDFTDEAVGFIDRHAREPFFLYLAYNAPHVPLQATKKYLDRFRSMQDPHRRVYAAMVSALDDGVGRVVQELDRKGLRYDTVVIFLSDNGCTVHVNGACSNAPLSGWKGYPWDGGIRIPYVVAWPGHLKPGVSHAPVSSLDIFPTAAALAGAQPPKALEGVNLLPFLKGDARSLDRQLYWKIGTSHMVREGRWKLLVVKKAPGDAKVPGKPAPGTAGAEPTPAEAYTLLYDLQADPGEKHDVAGQHPDVVRRLQAGYGRWAKGNAPPMFPTGMAEYADVNGYKVELDN